MIHMIIGSATRSSIMHPYWPYLKMSVQCNFDRSSLKGLGHQMCLLLALRPVLPTQFAGLLLRNLKLSYHNGYI